MSDHIHEYGVEIVWEGDRGSGTSSYRAFSRDHRLTAGSKPPIAMSSDPAFRGDAARWNPEDLLVGSLSSCHMLWYLHLAAEAGIVVRAYVDTPIGRMIEEADGGGRFTEVVLRPSITISAGDPDAARDLHHAAHEKCFVGNSVNFPVRVEPVILVAAADAPVV